MAVGWVIMGLKPVENGVGPVQPTVDLFASESNFKCPKWVNLGRSDHHNCIGFDFFSLNPDKIERDLIYAFPPKNCINQVATHMAKFYKRHKILLIFHSFGEIPAGIASLIQIGGRLQLLTGIKTVIPAEYKLIINDKVHWGFFNTKAKALYVLILNL